MKIKNEVLEKGGLVPYKLDAGDERFTVSEMPAEVAAEIITKGKKGDSVGGYMLIDERHYFPENILDFEEGKNPKQPKSAAKE